MENNEEERKMAFQRLKELTISEFENSTENEYDFFQRISKFHWWQLDEKDFERRNYIFDKSAVNRYAQELLKKEEKSIIFTVEPDKIREYLNVIEEKETHPIIKKVYLNLCNKYLEQGWSSLTEIEIELFNNKVAPNLK